MPFAEKKLSLQVTTTVSYINTRLILHRFAAQRYKNIAKNGQDFFLGNPRIALFAHAALGTALDSGGAEPCGGSLFV